MIQYICFDVMRVWMVLLACGVMLRTWPKRGRNAGMCPSGVLCLLSEGKEAKMEQIERLSSVSEKKPLAIHDSH